MRLGLVAESALAGGLDPGSPGDRFQVTVHVDAETLSSGEAASAAADISAETLAIYPAASEAAAPAADGTAGQAPMEPAVGLDLAAGQAVIEEAGGLHVGREAARRVACDAGRVVLRHAADGKVLDVGRRTRTVPTVLRRALESRDRNQCQFPGCSSRHCDAHHVVHWADGGAPLAPTVARMAAAGITIGPHTATPEWYGESLNVAAALDVLWEPRDRPGER